MADAETAPRDQKPRGVHLVGSVPLSNSEEVFRAAASLGGRLRRIPDGETGVRSNWITWQIEFLGRSPQLEVVPPDPNSTAYGVRTYARLRPGVSADDITFDGGLGYADAAIASYAIFARLQREGVIPAGTRFQVCLPTPLATITAFIQPNQQAAVEPAYERALLSELDRITAAIPHDELAIQWDVAVEFGIWEGVMPSFLTAPADLQRALLDRLLRLGNRVPADVQLGYHLCYGDAGHQHFMQPKDTSKLVEAANAVSAGVQRPINWIHLPVPIDRSDDAYFAPLRNLKLHPETELYLGLVHLHDGADGTQQRIAAARAAAPAFGVATECGLGRRPPETITDLLRIHAEVADPVSA